MAAALTAAHAVAGAQQYPAGALYVVATPIGNLADISLRALHVLSLVDRVACEDTRHSQSLLRNYGIASRQPLLALHEHNEAEAAAVVIDALRQGQRVAYISDAGTPAISDPGARLVQAVCNAGLPLMPIPGASSVTTALSVAGTHCPDGFVFAGFLPARAAERESALQALALESRAVVLLEAPHRMTATAGALASVFGERTLTVARELTKQFEQIAQMPAAQFPQWLADDPQRMRGEFVLVLHGAPRIADPAEAEGLRVLDLLLAELPLKSAVQLAARISGASRNKLYEAALQRQSERS